MVKLRCLAYLHIGYIVKHFLAVIAVLWYNKRNGRRISYGKTKKYKIKLTDDELKELKICHPKKIKHPKQSDADAQIIIAPG